LFDAARHLNAAAELLSSPAERRDAAALDLEAGRRAQRAGAYPLALATFEAGQRLLEPDGWTEAYPLALALSAGAAEAAYAGGEWAALDRHVEATRRRARTVLDQILVSGFEIDGWIARRDYGRAVSTALAALALLGVDLPRAPGAAEVAASVERAGNALRSVGPDGIFALPAIGDSLLAAAMQIETHIASAAYFATPLLFPILAAELVATSVEHGLCPATPYAISIYGVVLNTLGRHAEAHVWGQVALRLLERWPDRRLEARTRHVVHDLVCVWTVPLSSTLDALHAVIDTAKEIGDLEYSGYAAHAWVHNAFYAARPSGRCSPRRRRSCILSCKHFVYYRFADPCKAIVKLYRKFAVSLMRAGRDENIYT